MGVVGGGLGLRGRLTALSVLGFAVALAAMGAVLYVVLGWAGQRSLVADEAATAAQVARLVQDRRLPDPMPATGTQIVQVVDSRLRVVSASTNADRLTALLLPSELPEASSGNGVTVSGSRVGLDSPILVTARRIAGATSVRTVLVGEPVKEITHGRQALLRALLVGYPLLVLLFGAIAWLMTGWTLRPVEALRSGAERISGSGRDDRLPVPGSHDEIRALAVTLNAMLDRLEGARARQRAFVSDAAHELRSPLTSMRTQIEVAQHLNEATPLEDDLLIELVRLSSLVEGLLLLARSDAGSVASPEPEPLGAATLLAAVAARREDARVPVLVRPVPGSLTLFADRGDVDRILSNLVDNAVRHATGSVELSAYAEGSHTLLAVDDDGPGVPEPDRDRVFERFTRLDEARDRDSGGSGLGLAIVRELTTRAGGTVRVGESALGGLRVEVRLPRAAGPAGR